MEPLGFTEETAQLKMESVPLSHLSIEVGHFYSEDYARDEDTLSRYFRRVAKWTETARGLLAAELDGVKPRVSTCFLVDDYFGKFGGPNEVIPRVERLAAEAGLNIDYLARESCCAVADGHDLARVVEGQIVSEPAPGDNGARPPVSVSGWLSNGRRSPKADQSAMAIREPWQPPRQHHVARRHSVFMDVELWSEERGVRTWSCAFLAAVWQLLRLGLIRDKGAAVAKPAPRPSQWPKNWDELPAVTRLPKRAEPFYAYRAMSIMDTKFGNVEQAVRTILNQVKVRPEIGDPITERALGEGVDLPSEFVDRLEYILIRGV